MYYGQQSGFRGFRKAPTWRSPWSAAVLLVTPMGVPLQWNLVKNDHWALPSGKADKRDDTVEDTARRELREETGVKVPAGLLRLAFCEQRPNKTSARNAGFHEHYLLAGATAVQPPQGVPEPEQRMEFFDPETFLDHPEFLPRQREFLLRPEVLSGIRAALLGA